MKSLIFALSLMLTSVAIASPAPMAKMENLSSNIIITFSDFMGAVGFENYECKIDMGSWIYTMRAKALTVNNEKMYRCLSQGMLSHGTTYDVWFVFEDRPYSRVSQSAVFRLSTDNFQ